jgi:DnaK suppressor protein
MKKTEKKSSAQDNRDKKIQEIRKKLVRQREELLSDAGPTLTALPGETTTELGDQASAEIDRNFTLRLRDRERKLLKKIEETIESIDRGEYGICETCGCEISIKRLEARPVTTMCIDCKTEQEEEEKLRER